MDEKSFRLDLIFFIFMQLWESVLWYNFDMSILGISSVDYLIFFSIPLLGILLIIICIFGIFYKKLSLIHLLLIFEMLVLSINLLAVSFGFYFQNVEGYLIFLIMLTLAAAESAIGLSLIILLYRYKQFSSLNSLTNIVK